MCLRLGRFLGIAIFGEKQLQETGDFLKRKTPLVSGRKSKSNRYLLSRTYCGPLGIKTNIHEATGIHSMEATGIKSKRSPSRTSMRSGHFLKKV
jgi:hypothetical protein